MGNIATLLTMLAFISSEAVAENRELYEQTSTIINNELLKYSLSKKGNCAVFRILSATNLEIKSVRKMCSYEGRSFWDQVADAHFYNISFSGAGIKFYLSITPLYPVNEQIYECIAPIKASELLPIICTPPEKSPLER
ncbi:hypothetical protein [Pseudomonas alvandae]|uniref:hypothetical protein n=1 Tax=Pseudomonas canavaninivorans TaxID=2842348 RepID=UPI002B1E06BD|nr:hypothetical protein [Pseudomonas canavaninivorans]